MRLDEAEQFFNMRGSGANGPRVSYVILKNVGESIIMTVQSDDFTAVEQGKPDLGGRESKYGGLQVIVKDELSGKDKVWSIQPTAGRVLVNKMRELGVQSPKGFTLKLTKTELTGDGKPVYNTDVVKTPVSAAVSAGTGNELAERTYAILKGMSGIAGQPDGTSLIVKVRLGVSQEEARKAVEELTQSGRIAFVDGKLQVK